MLDIVADPMRVSVVIVNWNSCEDLDTCLGSLARQTHRDLEIIVVDNGSSDRSCALVRERYPGVRLVETGENLGFAGGCNRGIAVADGEWILLLNNDTSVEPDWASALVDAARSVPARCGMLQSMMVYTSRPGIVNTTGITLLRGGDSVDRGEGDSVDRWRDASEIFCPSAGAAAYRRAMLDEVKLSTGWLDQTYFLYVEDVDLGWRARLAGWSARYVPDSVVHHKWHGSSDRHGKPKLHELVTINRLRTFLKNASPTAFARATPRFVESTAQMVRGSGPRSLVRLRAGARSSWALRGEVDRLLRTERRAVEDRWMT